MAKLSYKNGQTSIVIRVKIIDSTSVIGAGKTGLTSSSAGLIISTIADNESSATTYTQAGSTIETITTLGTFAAPTATKCRFKEVDSTNFPGLYEIQIADARWAVSSARSVIISLPGVSGLGTKPVMAEVQLTAVDPMDSTRYGMSALPNAAAEASGGLFTRGSGAGQINQPGNGLIDVSLKAILNTALTETAGQLAGGFKQFFNIASPTSTMNLITAVTTATNLTTNNDKTGYALSAAGVQAIWDALTSALTTANSIGKRLADDIDAAISSRSTYAGGAVASVTAGVTVTTNNDKTGYGLSSAAVQAIWDALTSALSTTGSIGKLLVTNIDAAISSRSTFAGGAVASVTGNVGGNVNGNVVGSVGSVVAAVSANLTQILGTAFTEGASGRIAAGFKELLNIATPVFNLASVNQTGDSFDRLGAPITTTIAADIDNDTNTIMTILLPINGTVSDNLDVPVSTRSSHSVADIWNALLTGITTAGSIGKLIKDNVDAAISSRMATFSYTTPPSVTAIRTEMDTNSTKLANLDAAVSTRSTLTAANIWDALTSGMSTSGSIGKLIKDNLDGTISGLSTTLATILSDVVSIASYVTSNLDATVSSRSTLTAANVWDDLTSAIVTSGSIGKLLKDMLDVTVGSRLATSGYTTPPTVAAIRTEMDSNSTRLSHLDVDVSTRLEADFIITGTGTAQAGAANEITLQAGSNSNDNYYRNYGIYLTGGLGAGQFNAITGYEGATQIAEVATPWAIVPDNTTTYRLALLNGAGGNAATGDPWSTNLVTAGYTGNQAGAEIVAILAKANLITTTTVDVSGPQLFRKVIRLKNGDDYFAIDGRGLFQGQKYTNVASLIGATIRFKVNNPNSSGSDYIKTGVVDASDMCHVDVPSTDVISLFAFGSTTYDLEATLANHHVVTIQEGVLYVDEDVR